MSRLPKFAALALTLSVAATPAMAQGQSYSGAFARQYPEAAAKLHSFSMVHAGLLENLHNNPTISVARLDGPVYQEYLSQIQSPEPAMSHGMAAAMPRFAESEPQLVEVLDWAHTLQNDLYDIFADPNLANRDAAAEEAIDRYLSRSDLALPATTNSMDFMNGQEYSMGFRQGYPMVNGLMWSAHWLQLALFDPLLYYSSEADKDAGVATVLNRFEELLADGSDSFPMAMPTPAAITPELTRRHPRAAAILNNLNMLHDIVADALIAGSVSNKQMAINEALRGLRSPTQYAVSDYDWVVGQLRHGIYFQGGPAIGRLDRPERAEMNHGDMDMQMTMPGMPAGTTGGGGTMPPAESDQADPHAGH